MHAGRVSSPTRALPLRNMQHITSASVPSIALGDGHLPRLPYKPIVSAEGDQNPPTALRDTGTLSSCLLFESDGKDAARQTGEKKIRSLLKDSTKMTSRGDLTFGRTVASKTDHFGSFKLQTSPARNKCADEHGVSSTMSRSHFGNLAKASATRSMNLSKKMTQTYSGTRGTTNSTMCRTVPKEMLPPLVTVLEHYIHREMGAASEGGASLTAQERLHPFREAFFAFIDAFPAYSKILNDILSAYDGVVQEQAKMIVDLIMEQSQQEFDEGKHRFEMGELKKTIQTLTTELDEARSALIEEAALPSSPTTKRVLSNQHMSLSEAKGSNHKDRKKLVEAMQRIKELEEISKGDLEKHLVLINALRESDKRVRALELHQGSLNTQLEELNDFKIMAGEAQKQFEEFKVKYQNFISVQDHEAIREYLTGELQAAQNLARQYRRSAAVRGTQVDVIGRKLKASQEENEQLLEVIDEDRLKLLTPRPDWDKIHASLPDLKEIAGPIEALPLEGDEAITSTVPGLSETRLQVEYLVECINSLSQELKRRMMVLTPMKTPVFPLLGQGMEPHVPLHLRACGIIPRAHLDLVEVVLLVHDFFADALQPHRDVLHRTLDIPKLYKEFLAARIKSRETLKNIACPEHLAINLADMAKDKEHCRPSLMLLDGILSGAFPARLACDVVMILENVRSEIKGLGEAQRKARISRVAISDCLVPVMQLKSAEEVDTLKKALGSDTSHDIEALCATGSKFMLTLLDQECASGMKFYVNLVERLFSYAYYLQSNDKELVISLDKVGRAIMEVEPLTPKTVVKEIIEKSGDSKIGDEGQITRFSDVMHILTAAPLIRRTARVVLDEKTP